MKKNSILKKLLSRKFIISLITVISGIAVMAGADESIVETVAGALVTALPSLIYIITEGKLDLESINSISAVMEDMTDGSEEQKKEEKDYDGK